MEYPLFFTHTEGYNSDALYVRHDDETSEAIVVDNKGHSRKPNMDGWNLYDTLIMVVQGQAKEITPEEAENMLRNVT